MNEEFLKILMDPLSKEELVLNGASNTLVSVKSGNSYKLHHQIPVFVNYETEGYTEVKPDLHDRFETKFSYKSHYQKDAEYFNYYDEFEHAASNHEVKRLQQSIINRIDKKSNLIIDVGCGNAWLAKNLLAFGIKVVSMDISTVNPEKALKNYPHRNHFGLVADVFEMPVKENSVDCIVASEIMEHVIDPKKFVEILYGKLKPGGKLIITTPYNEKLEYYLCVHCNRPTPKNAHLHSFNENSIKQLIPLDSSWKYNTFSNEYLTKLRSHIVLKYSPFIIWKVIDKCFNMLFNKPARLMIIVSKK